jgi:hypothetical protein
VGTPRNVRSVETMETTMTKRTRPLKKTESRRTAKARTVARRSRQGPKTKKQIALSLLERAKGASIAEMQRAMGWQQHSVRGFLAGTVKKMADVTLISEKAESGSRRYRVVSVAE